MIRVKCQPEGEHGHIRGHVEVNDVDISKYVQRFDIHGSAIDGYRLRLEMFLGKGTDEVAIELPEDKAEVYATLLVNGVPITAIVTEPEDVRQILTALR